MSVDTCKLEGQDGRSIPSRSSQDMGLVESYRNVMENAADPRVADWSLMGSPLPILGIIFLYLLFVLRLGPLYMKNRKPYNLYNVMICYNMSVVIASAAVFYGLLTSGFTTSLSLGCEMHNASYDPESYRMAKWVWWVMQLKIYEFGDTIIFILRKKYRQVSFLHIYHHASTVFMSWSACKFVPGGMWTFPIMVNCIMHVIMYIYYLLACFGSEMQKNIAPWKRYITTLQIIQFFIMITHFSQAFLPSCEPNRKPLACLYMSEMLLMLYMFSVYYKNSYIRKKAE